MSNKSKTSLDDSEPSLFAWMLYSSIVWLEPNIKLLSKLDSCACVFIEWPYTYLIGTLSNKVAKIRNR